MKLRLNRLKPSIKSIIIDLCHFKPKFYHNEIIKIVDLNGKQNFHNYKLHDIYFFLIDHQLTRKL
jgi:hypothetical protein